MFALISRILNLSGRYKSRIQAAFLCAFVESILSKMPIFMAFIVLAGFADELRLCLCCAGRYGRRHEPVPEGYA